MMPLLYINLARSPERRDFMEGQARRLGLAFSRLEAVDGKAMAEAEYQRLCPERNGRRLGRGELACFMSHIEAWRIIGAGSAPFGVVFEDDVYLSGALAPLLADPGWLPAGAEIVKLTGNAHRFTMREAASARVGTRGLHRVLTGTIDSGGYVISAAHARELSACAAPFTRPIDRVLMDPGPGPVIYQLMPAGAVQSKFAGFAFLPGDEGASLVQTADTIHPRRSLGAKLKGEVRNLRVKVLRPLLLPARQMFTAPGRRVMIKAAPFEE